MGSVKKVDTGQFAASIYAGSYTHEGRWITLQDRGQPKTFIARFEAEVQRAVPGIEFVREFK